MDIPMPGIVWGGYNTPRKISKAKALEMREQGAPEEGLILGVDNFAKGVIHSIPSGDWQEVALNNLDTMLEYDVVRLVKRDVEGEIAAFTFTVNPMVFAEMASANVRMHVRSHVANGEAVIGCSLRGDRLNAASIFMEPHQAGAYLRVKDAVVLALSDGDSWNVIRVCRRNANYIIQNIAEGDIHDSPSKAGKFKDAVLASIKSANGVIDRYCNYRGNAVDQQVRKQAHAA